MMWVKLVVAFSEPGMYMRQVTRQVSPGSHLRYELPPVRSPVTSWRWRSAEVSRSTVCMLNLKLSPSVRMCVCPAGWLPARSSSTVSKAPRSQECPLFSDALKRCVPAGPGQWPGRKGPERGRGAGGAMTRASEVRAAGECLAARDR